MLRINGRYLISLIVISFFPCLVLADVCPDASTLKRIGHHVFAQDSGKRRLFFDNINSKIPFVQPYQIAFTGAQIVHRGGNRMRGHLRCDYTYTTGAQTYSISLIDFNSADPDVQPVGRNWSDDKTAAQYVTVCNTTSSAPVGKNTNLISPTDCPYLTSSKKPLLR